MRPPVKQVERVGTHFEWPDTLLNFDGAALALYPLAWFGAAVHCDPMLFGEPVYLRYVGCDRLCDLALDVLTSSRDHCRRARASSMRGADARRGNADDCVRSTGRSTAMMIRIRSRARG